MSRSSDVQGLGPEDLVINLGVIHTPLGQLLALTWWAQWPQANGSLSDLARVEDQHSGSVSEVAGSKSA